MSFDDMKNFRIDLEKQNAFNNLITNTVSLIGSVDKSLGNYLDSLKDFEKKEEINDFYLKLAGPALINYCKTAKKELQAFNYYPQVKLQCPYMEIFYDNGDGTQTVYNNNRIRNALCTSLSSDLDINDNPMSASSKRFLTMNLQLSGDVDYDNSVYPLYKEFNYKNNSKISQKFQKIAINTIGTKQYQENTVSRWTTWVYYPSTTVYCLVCPDPFKIYVMQTYSNDIDATINPTNFAYMGEKLTLPTGWIYTYLYLDKDTILTVPSNGRAIVISDSFSNAYQYVTEEAAPWLYSQYKK